MCSPLFANLSAAQVTELKAANCQRIYHEKISGARSDRKQLVRLTAGLDKGDVLVVTRLDRLARSTRDLLNLLGAVAEKGARPSRRPDTHVAYAAAVSRYALKAGVALRCARLDLARGSTPAPV